MLQLSHHDCVRLLADAAAEMRGAIASFVDPVTLASINRSIEQAKSSVAGDLPNDQLRDSANSATRLTGKAELYSRGMYLNDSDRDTPLGRLSSDQLQSVRDVADVAARSLRAATGDVANANTECQEGLSWAYELAKRTGDNNLLARIEHLVASAHSNLTQVSGDKPKRSARRWWAFWKWLRG